ncbi:hypothetical protein [Cellulomonas oligotrophica]|uniref:Uncharacterized protein n=1 Tax=Cellulomonas oligotrophica TaxID=931536 RepID=A0A7Y9FCS3_9CELL|nr:hypothetical protein [Cellulomonas oligotrophica]NYD84969.1 hypothetical protein [Cellulomonas oligotrophica]GIG32040.1 hypothetical protein Col01nite_11990 [Cellulomonas oligotrophica]
MAARPDDAPGADDRSPAEGPDGPGEAPPPPPAHPAPGGEQDAAWASIVARLDDLRDLDLGLGDDADPASRRPAEDGSPADEPVLAAGAAGPVVLSGRDWDGTAQYDEAEDAVDDHEHFVPPDPGPVLGGDPLLTMAWVAVAAAPLLLLVVALGWRDAPTLLVRGALVVFVAAVGLLVWRMPHRRDPSDDDTGAVV